MSMHQYSDNNHQISALSQELGKSIAQILNKKPRVTLAVSGGKSPIKLFEKLSHYPLEWKKVTITLVDDRFVPLEHMDSNERLVRQHLLVNNTAAANFISLVDPKHSITTCVNNANDAIKQIDLAIIGMGDDGHTASLFPCCHELLTAMDTSLTPQRYVITNPVNANHQRISLSLAGLLDIPKIFLSISGNKKKEILHSAEEGIDPQYPISYLLAEHHNLQIYWHP
jgi:6-phosphogluconolactonase